MEKINIIIADDHTLVRKGMVKLVSTFKRVGDIKEAANGQEIFDLLPTCKANVVLVDIAMPVMDGFATSEALILKYPEIKIIVVTMFDDEALIVRMLELGVHAYLTKNADPEEFEQAIYSVVDLVYLHFSKNKIETQNLRVGRFSFKR